MNLPFSKTTVLFSHFSRLYQKKKSPKEAGLKSNKYDVSKYPLKMVNMYRTIDYISYDPDSMHFLRKGVRLFDSL